MKTILTLGAILLVLLAHSQNVPDSIKLGTTVSDAKHQLEDGYTMENGWTIKVGDTLKLGTGTLPTRQFAYIYENPLSMGNIYDKEKHYLPSNSSKYAIVKEIFPYGTKKHGFTITAKVGVGEMVNYWIELDNAVAVNELIAPDAYAKKTATPAAAAAAPATSKADELKKWKDLLDAGAITKEEYEAQKKKILEQ